MARPLEIRWQTAEGKNTLSARFAVAAWPFEREELAAAIEAQGFTPSGDHQWTAPDDPTAADRVRAALFALGYEPSDPRPIVRLRLLDPEGHGFVFETAGHWPSVVSRIAAEIVAADYADRGGKELFTLADPSTVAGALDRAEARLNALGYAVTRIDP